jgi:hypothetical protein
LGWCCRRAPPPPSATLLHAAAAGSQSRVVLWVRGRLPAAPAGVRRAGRQRRAAAAGGCGARRCRRSVDVQTPLFTACRPRTMQQCLPQ